ncbi:G-box-binding factor-like [Oncorhynchus masou masou]|uniref:G-box-binding factor-like n=1 Tax=Oncorhynchus masou masou TaxID=90313 RepID=UPI0031844D7F
MGGLTLTLLLLCLSGTLSEDAGEDNLNDIMVQIQPEQGQDIENEYKTHNQHSEQEQDIENEYKTHNQHSEQGQDIENEYKTHNQHSEQEQDIENEYKTHNQHSEQGQDIENEYKTHNQHSEQEQDIENEYKTHNQHSEQGQDIESEVIFKQNQAPSLAETNVQAAQLRVMETKLSTSESLMKSMKRENEVQERKLQVLSFRVDATEFRVEQQQILLDELRRQSEDGPKIAFTAALGGDGHTPPSERETNLAFSNVFTNVGNAYNPGSGVFNTPVKGVYYFSFSSFASSQHNVCVSLFKNNVRMLSACDHHTEHDSSDSSGNGGTLHLEQGDHVYMTLHAHSHIFADFHNRSTFRGFLLFRT